MLLKTTHFIGPRRPVQVHGPAADWELLADGVRVGQAGPNERIPLHLPEGAAAPERLVARLIEAGGVVIDGPAIEASRVVSLWVDMWGRVQREGANGPITEVELAGFIGRWPGDVADLRAELHCLRTVWGFV